MFKFNFDANDLQMSKYATKKRVVKTEELTLPNMLKFETAIYKFDC